MCDLVIILEIYQPLPSLSARTHSCWCGRSVRLRYWRVSWDWGLRGGIGWRSGWPRHRRWDSTGSAGLYRGRATVEADASIVVDVGMEHLGHESYLWRFGGVFLGEVEGKFEQSALPCRALGALDESGPLQEVAFLGGGVDALVFFVTHLL